MEKQVLHEHHNLQDKAKKPDYQERFLEEGDNYDRGGTGRRRLIYFRGSSIFVEVQERHEMTCRSIARTSQIVDIIKHPKKNFEGCVVEFKCFLQPLEPFANTIFRKHFAFRMNIVQQRPLN